MSGSTLHTAAASCSVLELFILTAAAYLIFRRRRYTLAEASAYAVISVFFLLSFCYQTAFLTGWLKWIWLIELPLTAGGVAILFIHRRLLAATANTVWRLMRQHRLAVISLTMMWLYLLWQALLWPSDSLPWHELARMQIYRMPNGLFAGAHAENGLSVFDGGASLNQSILPHLFLRTHAEIGAGLLGFWAYGAIGFATYALSRRYSWPATSLTVTMVVISMPRFVFLATTASNEIIIAAAVVFCLLAAYRAIERPNPVDLGYLMCGIFFNLGPNRHSITLALPLTVLAAVLLFRRHGIGVWRRMVVNHRRWLLGLIPVFFIFSQLWFWGIGLGADGTAAPPPPAATMAYNPDGIQGALANLLRYLFETAHFTRPIDLLCGHVFGFKLSALLQYLHDRIVVAGLGNPGTALTLQIRWIPDARHVWFGPFGLLLSLPAVVYALLRAPRRLKTIAVTLFGYVFLTALIFAWHPRNVGSFSVFFGCSGACMALFLSPWRIGRRGRRNLQLAAILLLVYAAFYQQRPLTGLSADLSNPASPRTSVGIDPIHDVSRTPPATAPGRRFAFPPLRSDVPRRAGPADKPFTCISAGVYL